MPTPVSRTVTTAPRSPSGLSLKTRRPPRGNGLEGVGEEIGEDLAQAPPAARPPTDGIGLDVDLVGDAPALRLVLSSAAGSVSTTLEAHDVEEPDAPERPGPARAGELLDAPDRLGAVEGRLVDQSRGPGERPAARARRRSSPRGAPDDDGEEAVGVAGHAGRHLAERSKLRSATRWSRRDGVSPRHVAERSS